MKHYTKKQIQEMKETIEKHKTVADELNAESGSHYSKGYSDGLGMALDMLRILEQHAKVVNNPLLKTLEFKYHQLN